MDRTALIHKKKPAVLHIPFTTYDSKLDVTQFIATAALTGDKIHYSRDVKRL